MMTRLNDWLYGVQDVGGGDSVGDGSGGGRGVEQRWAYSFNLVKAIFK